jgi:hypothetical protein
VISGWKLNYTISISYVIESGIVSGVIAQPIGGAQLMRTAPRMRIYDPPRGVGSQRPARAGWLELYSARFLREHLALPKKIDTR